MNLVQLGQIRKNVDFALRELSEAYEKESQEYIIKVQDDASTFLFWYYLEIGSMLRDYQEEENQMLDNERERTGIVKIIEGLRFIFNNTGDDLKKIARVQRKSGMTNFPE